jgi:hypothetical protein
LPTESATVDNFITISLGGQRNFDDFFEVAGDWDFEKLLKIADSITYVNYE